MRDPINEYESLTIEKLDEWHDNMLKKGFPYHYSREGLAVLFAIETIKNIVLEYQTSKQLVGCNVEEYLEAQLESRFPMPHKDYRAFVLRDKMIYTVRKLFVSYVREGKFSKQVAINN